MEQRLSYVKVTNHGDAPYIDMYDGVPVTIDPGGSQNIRPEQAFHFFGWTEDARKEQMALHTAKRRGWNTSEHLAKDESGKPGFQRLFEQLTIEPVTFKLVEETPAADQPIPADPDEANEDEQVEHASSPPKFVPVKPRARTPKAKPGDDAA
jgi:hypothetical protein